jgi:hybrid cluster-associated redox disulfide protein
MRRWPKMLRVFLDYKMNCIGCPFARFMTVEEACREHGVDSGRFLADLNAVLNRSGF